MIPPPLFVSFPSLDRFTSSLDYSDLFELQPPLSELAGRRLPPVASAKSLAVLFGYSTRFVLAMAARPEKYYRVFELIMGQKRRLIESPRVALKVIQTWFGHHLARAIEFPSYVHGFVPGRSTITAAQAHLNASWVASIDIRDFFHSTPRQKIEETISTLGYPEKAAKVLARLMTFKDALPQGSPASPVLANLAFRQVDASLDELARAHGARYTRYADDLVFSGTDSFPETLIESASAALICHGWALATEKTSIQKRPMPLRVHGLLVHGSKVRLCKPYRKRLRMMKYALDKKVLDESTERRYRGHLAYGAAVGVDRF